MLKQGINPVTLKTLPPWQPLNVTLARLHIGVGGPPKALTQIVISDPDASTPEELKGSPLAVVDEGELVGALGHLFCRGELTYAHLMDPAPDETSIDIESIVVTLTLPRLPSDVERRAIQLLREGAATANGRRVALSVPINCNLPECAQAFAQDLRRILNLPK